MQQPIAIEKLYSSAYRHDDHAWHERALLLIHFCGRKNPLHLRTRWEILGPHHRVSDAVVGREDKFFGPFFFAADVLIKRYRKNLLFNRAAPLSDISFEF